MRLCKLPTSTMSADFQPFPMAMPHDAQARHSVRPVRPPPSDGMDEPVILRGLLYFLILAAFFIIRYILDVLLTPRVLDAAAHAAIDCIITAPRCSLNLLRSCSAALLPWATLRVWRCCDAAMMEKACLYVAALQLGLKFVCDSSLVVGRLRKGDLWPMIVPLVMFTRVSSGRSQGPHRWRCGRRGLLCAAAPWMVRIGALVALYQIFVAPLVQSLRRSIPAMTGTGPHNAQPGWNDCNTEPLEGGCTSFTGQPLPCRELMRARDFNQHVLPTMRQATYREIRRAMTDNELYGSAWHVGHACPDPNKDSVADQEDRGWNLFAQHATDNVRLGHCVVSCAEADYVGASSVPCASTGGCSTDCASANGRRA